MRSIEWWHCRWPWVPPNRPKLHPFSVFCTAIHSVVTCEPRDFKFGTLTYHNKSHPADEKYSLIGAWSGSREQFLHCGLKKFRNSKSSVCRWYTQFDRRRFVYDTWDNGSQLGRVMIECTLSITHCLRLNLQLHTTDLVRTCRISCFCTVAWQLARFQLTRRIARSLGDSWASCSTVQYAKNLKYWRSVSCATVSKISRFADLHAVLVILSLASRE